MKRLVALMLVLSLVFSTAAWSMAEEAAPTETASYSPLQYGDSGDVVASVQEQLKSLGYYSGKVSGNFLDGTRAAVRQFQKDYGLEETGIVDGETEALIMSAEYRSLTTGDEGDDVKRVQEYLTNLGYYKGKLSGKYLEGTTSAIKTFQEKNQLSATGTADVTTQRLLFSSAALAKDAPEATETPAPGADLGDINDVVMAADGATDTSAATLAAAEYSKKLNRGSKGEQVKQVQQRLTDLGYFSGPISGNYMNQTVAAVKLFQEHNGLSVDGITGEETWNYLFSSELALDIEASPRPTPEPTPIPYAITVDVRNQATLVYGRDENGEYTVPVKQFICSTGLKATPSDVGEWTLNGRTARWCYFSKYGSYAQYWTRINAYIAFHSVIYRKVDYNALSVKSYKKLGQRASHGCIRLTVADAKWIYDNVGEGTVVTVTEDLPDDPELRASLKTAPLGSNNYPISTPEPTAKPVYSSTAQPPQPFRTLQKNSTGEDVFWLQSKLAELGYYTGAITGTFLGGTEKAVKAFQKDHSLRSNGKANEETLTAIYADVLPTATPVPTDTPEPTEVPTPSPVPTPTVAPTATPTLAPTATPTATVHPTDEPTSAPSATSASTATDQPAETAADDTTTSAATEQPTATPAPFHRPPVSRG